MAANFMARLRTLGSSAFRLAAALTMAAVAVGGIAFAAQWAYTYPECKQAKQAEIMRAWTEDLCQPHRRAAAASLAAFASLSAS